MFSDDNPRTWSDMSFEFKGMFAYHIVMVAMFLTGRGLAFVEQILIAAAIMLAIAIASFVRRRRHRWRWRGLTPLRAGGAVLVAALMAFFLFAAAGGALQAQGLALGRPFELGPWMLAGLGIAVFSVLNVLRITHISEKAFQEECGEQAGVAKPELLPEPRWKVITKYVFAAAFLFVWLGSMTFFYLNDRMLRAASPTPTVEQTVAINNKGVTVYVAPAEKHLVDQLQGFMFIGIPAAIATAFFLQFVLKIRFNEFR
ncbi:MAG: hypothetical protein HOP13_14875 [Alphaproteobacteria bacterium]|jgi:hypothetical protein|nr:hypothetical protein [Alphaproteobacteria bacterium]